MAETAKKKRSHVPKNRKKAWRKFSNIDDVEEFLEDQRLEERLGGCFADRLDENLFMVDSVGATKQCKKKRKPEEFRCFQFLKLVTNVKDPLIKRNRVRTPEERAHPAAKKRQEEKLLKKIALNVKAAKGIANNPETISYLKTTAKFSYDLWEHKSDKELENDEDLQPNVTEHTLVNTRRKLVKAPHYRHVKPSALPGVEVPHPGTSYNPSFKDHQKLLRKADKIEREKLKKKEHWQRKTTDLFPTGKDAPTKETWIKEMSEGLFSKGEAVVKQEKEEGKKTSLMFPPKDEVVVKIEVEEGNETSVKLLPNDEVAVKKEEEGDETSVMLPPKATVRKTRRQRKHENKCRSKQRVKILKKAKQQKLQDVSRVKSFLKEIKSKEEKLLLKKMSREAQTEAKKLQPHRLCKHKYEAPELELNLSDEITGNLRTMQHEGNLILDRYKSFQKKNIIEPRHKIRHNWRYKPRKYWKHGHKMGWENKPLDAVMDYVE